MEDKESNLSSYTRVSDILAPFSGYSHIPVEILLKAADRGTVVHQICAAYIKSLMPFLVPEYQGYVDSFLEWKSDKKIIMPDRFYDSTHMITGECDGLYDNGNGYTLFDLKTSSKEGVTWRYQGAAYKYLAELCGFKITGIEFIHLSKDGSRCKIYDYFSSWKQDFLDFEKMIDFYEKFFKKSKKMQIEHL